MNKMVGRLNDKNTNGILLPWVANTSWIAWSWFSYNKFQFRKKVIENR